ncbi:MAG: PEP-CTERM sorting domain-containing protein [Mariniblastus sp.]|nr:PEP-CTERM sorting domain-containing protein [Mariniblastus sp.]
MKTFLTLATSALLAFGLSTPNVSGDVLITGVFDGPLSGGVPKCMEVYVTADGTDLSQWAVGSANNGGGTDGAEFVLSGTANAGDYLYIASETTGFNTYFGFNPNFTSGALSINGDDAIELFFDASGAFSGSETVHDTFGDINTDGSGEAWDYLDGWVYRVDDTGADGSTFVLNNWTYSGINVNDGETSNDTAANPWPLGTYSMSAIPEPGSTAILALVGLMGLVRRRK